MLADRGFDIGEDVARIQASLKIPAFTKGCTQLNPRDIEETRQLASVRIHIERVIGNEAKIFHTNEYFAHRICETKIARRRSCYR